MLCYKTINYIIILIFYIIFAVQVDLEGTLLMKNAVQVDLGGTLCVN